MLLLGFIFIPGPGAIFQEWTQARLCWGLWNKGRNFPPPTHTSPCAQAVKMISYKPHSHVKEQVTWSFWMFKASICLALHFIYVLYVLCLPEAYSTQLSLTFTPSANTFLNPLLTFQPIIKLSSCYTRGWHQYPSFVSKQSLKSSFCNFQDYRLGPKPLTLTGFRLKTFYSLTNCLILY